MKCVWIWILIVPLQGAIGFEYPDTASDNLAKFSSIVSTSACTTCNDTCPTRTRYPGFSKPLMSSACHAYNFSLPQGANPSNGYASFENSASDCSISESYSASEYFTLTFWVKLNCTFTCTVATLGPSNGTTLEYMNGLLRVTGLTAYLSNNSWQFVVLRYNGRISLFVQGLMQGSQVYNSSQMTLEIGPGRNLTGSESIEMVDARWYQDALTDREIMGLFSGNETWSDCRCPARYPKVVENLYSLKDMLCTDGRTEVLRLNPDAHLPVYMLDGNTNTSWKSGSLKSISVLLKFRKVFQWKNIYVQGITSAPAKIDRIVIRFRTNSTINNEYLFLQSCASTSSACFLLGIKLSAETFAHDFERNISTRSEYEKLLGNEVEIEFTGSTNTTFSVSELKLYGRCACYGNDKLCTVSNDTYSCTCNRVSTNNIGNHCETCNSTYYTGTTGSDGGFHCNNNCNCNSTGANGSSCELLSGQCNCKINVEGRTCDRCKHNTANFSGSGCTDCLCYPDGITSCENRLVCNCKANVDDSDRRCSACLSNFYNISNPRGCDPCDCSSVGTAVGAVDTCNSSTGECQCRLNVQGRTCDECKDEYFNLSFDNTNNGCEACMCNLVGSYNNTCNKMEGQCHCIERDLRNRQCIPSLTGMDPEYGPAFGGTNVTITGFLLGNPDAVVNFMIGNVKQTEIESLRTNTRRVFTTHQREDLGSSPISFTMTAGGITFKNETFENSRKFEYRKTPRALSEGEVQSYASGGCGIEIKGLYLQGVKYPKMLTNTSKAVEESPCRANTDEKMTCLTANVSAYGVNKTWNFRIQFDGDFTKEPAYVFVLPDPEIETKQNGVFRNTFDKIFRIKGSRLNHACRDSDVAVDLGGKQCRLLSRLNDSITCDPGEKFPGETRAVTVTVKIGNKNMTWGRLEIKAFWDLKEFIYIVVGASAFVVIVVIIIAVVCCVRRGACKKNKSSDEVPLEMDQLTKLSRRRTNDYEINPVAAIPPLTQELPKERTEKEIAEDFCNRLEKSVKKIVSTSLIDKENLDIPKNPTCTHKGKLIRVINGQYNSNTSSPYSGMGLTIKTLIEHYPEEGSIPAWLTEGLMECTRLRDFINENVLRMTGIVVDAKQVYIIYPEMANRTLKDYVLKETNIGSERLLEMCVQVAEGMDYLSSLTIVHKDLAARNCWVSREGKVKVADASFSYDLYPDDYYKHNEKYQPVRWMAPESLRQGFYDSKSDVWSYGVLMWEMYTPGYLPYHDIQNNKDIQQSVCDQGIRLSKPYGCPDKVFEVIDECHNDKGANRPNFFIIMNKLEHIMNPCVVAPVSYINEQNLQLYENTAFCKSKKNGPTKAPSTNGVGDAQLEIYENTLLKPTSPRQKKKV